MQAMPMFGGMESLLVLLMFGAGLPLGMPPEKENPVMGYVAPQECLLYSSWAGMAVPDPTSSNQTEQLLAEPEVREFALVLERALGRGLALAAQSSGDEVRANLLNNAGPLWARALLTRPGAVFLTRLTPQQQNLLVEGGLIVHAGEAAAALDETFTQWLAGDEKPSEVVISGRTFHKLTAQPEGLPVQVVWGATNGYVMVGLGEGAVEGISTRLAARAEPAWLAQVRQQLPAERRCSVSYVNTPKLVEILAPLGGPQTEQVIATLGLRQVGPLSTVTAMDETGIVSKSVLALDGPPRGLIALLENEGIGKADLAHIPADALLANCFSLEAARLLDTLVETIREVEPRFADEFENELKRFETESGLNLREVLSGLGNNWSLHASNADGGLLGATATVEVWDRARVLAAQNKLVAAFSEQANPRRPVIVASPFQGQTIYNLAPDGRLGLFVCPAWCLTEKQLIVGLYPQAVKGVLSRRVDDKSLADVPEVAAQLVQGKPPLALSYYDSPKLFEALYPSVQMLLPMGLAQTRGWSLPANLPATLPAPRTIGRHLRPTVTVTRRTERGLETETRQTLPGANIGASFPLVVAMLLPAVQGSRDAARRSQGSNNLKQQILALHNFHDTFNRFPAAYTTDRDGKPLLSWRVAILPFIEQQALFREFRLDEPWDSEHNKKLIPRMPATFLAPGSRAAPGMTNYLGVGGKAGVLAAPRAPAKAGQAETVLPNGVGMRDIIDGTSNTVMIVEANDASAVIWTKPEEWVPNENDPLKGLIGLRSNGFLAALADGSVRFLPPTTPAKTLQALFTRDGGEVIDRPERR